MNTGSSEPRRIPPIGWIILVGGLVRLALWLSFQGRDLHIWDERDYHRLAANLARYGEFAFTPGRPLTIRPPLYPAFVAGVYLATGVGNFQAVRLLQSGLSLLVVWLLYLLGGRIYDRRTGTWLAGLFCFYPSMLGFNNLLLTEVLFTTLLVAMCSTMIKAIQESSLSFALASGALLGLSALTRSVMWLFPAPLAVLLLLIWEGSPGRRLAAIAAVVLGFAAVIAPWAIRNTRVEKTFIPVDCMGGRNFMMGNYEYTPLFRAWDTIAIEGERSWHHVLASADPSSLGATQGQRDKLALRHGLRFVLAHPWLTAKRDLVKFCDFWGLERELVAGAARGYFGKPTVPALLLLTLIIFGSYATALVSGIFGAVMTPPTDRRIHWLLLLVIGFICGMHTLTFGHSRYHLPIMPLVLLYSAGAIVQRRAIWSRRREWPFRLACSLSAIVALGWLWEVIFVDLDRYLTVLKSGA